MSEHEDDIFTFGVTLTREDVENWYESLCEDDFSKWADENGDLGEVVIAQARDPFETKLQRIGDEIIDTIHNMQI